MEWMTSAKPLERKPPPFEKSELSESLDGIFRTGRIKSAGWGKQKP
jgi:hypothetical protein